MEKPNEGGAAGPAPEMDKAFDPVKVEPRWRLFWEERDLFRARPDAGMPPFCMVIPPPNITGRLHVGHGLNNTLQDVLARWKRMEGHDVLWLPGSDHASIATHVMIERELEKEGTTRFALGREKFIERAWAWKRKFGGEIVDQLRRLGSSCDWSRERFTMDPGLSRAVREVFVRLHEEGLVYRDRYLINWCPRCATAVSDLEVVHKEMRGKLWTVRYPLEGGGGISVATTRPETMLGDVAVAFHPDDDRYRSLAGRAAILPVLGRRIPLVADAFVDPTFGTGAVKVTPGHDPNDYLAGKRLGLEPIIVMDEKARMTAAAGPFAGMDRFECRAALLDRLRAEGLLEAEEEREISVGRCQRCDTIVEPMISRQWFVRMEPLAGPALQAVETGRIAFTPDLWRKTYNEWLRNIRDWCISRQLWWGHRIPAWYCSDCGETIVTRTDPDACTRCGGGRLEQDPDILDTWFSSALWAFSTLGWPDRTADLARYYPTSVLVTGYDIIFFWVARMVMMGLKIMEEVPFHAVFFNGLVRDAHGEKISKMKGNVIDLFEMLDTYGTDAVRFTYASMSSPGSDVALAPGRLEGSRAFANKIWNAVRFARPHLREAAAGLPASRKDLSAADRWILSRCSRVAGQAREALAAYRFDEAAALIYQFTWHELCDWYLEICKPALTSGGPGAEGTRAALRHVIDRVLRLLHPFMPFITEELWQALPRAAEAPASIALCEYPRPEPEWEDDAAESEMQHLIDAVTLARNRRTEMKIPAKELVEIWIHPNAPGIEDHLASGEEQLRRLTRASALYLEPIPAEIRRSAGVASSSGMEVAIHYAGMSRNVDAEREKLRRELEKISGELAVHEAKLANEGFLARGKPEAVAKVRAAHRELSSLLARKRAELEHLES